MVLHVEQLKNIFNMILKEDFNTHLYTEIINTISRNDDDVLNDAINAAVGEAQGYLHRFDLDELFSQVGADRDSTLLMYLKDMAVWHFIPVANPNIDVEYRRDRYKDAMTWLTKIQAGKVTPINWTLANEQTEQPSVVSVQSNPKRNTHF